MCIKTITEVAQNLLQYWPAAWCISSSAPLFSPFNSIFIWSTNGLGSIASIILKCGCTGTPRLEGQKHLWLMMLKKFSLVCLTLGFIAISLNLIWARI